MLVAQLLEDDVFMDLFVKDLDIEIAFAGHRGKKRFAQFGNGR